MRVVIRTGFFVCLELSFGVISYAEHTRTLWRIMDTATSPVVDLGELKRRIRQAKVRRQFLRKIVEELVALILKYGASNGQSSVLTSDNLDMEVLYSRARNVTNMLHVKSSGKLILIVRWEGDFDATEHKTEVMLFERDCQGAILNFIFEAEIILASREYELDGIDREMYEKHLKKVEEDERRLRLR